MSKTRQQRAHRALATARAPPLLQHRLRARIVGSAGADAHAVVVHHIAGRVALCSMAGEDERRRAARGAHVRRRVVEAAPAHTSASSHAALRHAGGTHARAALIQSLCFVSLHRPRQRQEHHRTSFRTPPATLAMHTLPRLGSRGEGGRGLLVTRRPSASASSTQSVCASCYWRYAFVRSKAGCARPLGGGRARAARLAAASGLAPPKLAAARLWLAVRARSAAHGARRACRLRVRRCGRERRGGRLQRHASIRPAPLQLL
jgi:hypothetical protein